MNWKSGKPRSPLRPTLWIVLKQDQHGNVYGPSALWLYQGQVPWRSPFGDYQWQSIDDYFYDLDLVSAIQLPLPDQWREICSASLVRLLEKAGIESEKCTECGGWIGSDPIASQIRCCCRDAAREAGKVREGPD